MEGVVAGVPSLADYDVIIDAGSDGSDPESAVPFSFTTKAGKEFKQPGNFFALVETSVFGTEPKFVAKGVEADLDGDGKVALPRGAAGRRLPARRHDRLRQVREGARRGREGVAADARGRATRPSS